METAELIEKIKTDGAVLYGTGFVAELFYEALSGIGLAGQIRYCVVSREGVAPFHGLPVYSLGQYAARVRASEGAQNVVCGNETRGQFAGAVPFAAAVQSTAAAQQGTAPLSVASQPETMVEPVLCLAVHDALRPEVEEALKAEGICDYEWIYPHYLTLAWGAPVRENVRISPRDILRMQPQDQYWITVRYAAMREMQEERSAALQKEARDTWTEEACAARQGSQDVRMDEEACAAQRETGVSAQRIYRKAIGLFSGAETARKRLDAAQALVRSIRENGFRSSSPILMDTRYRVLDGLHRLAAASLLNLPFVPCRIVEATERFETYFTEENFLTEEAQIRAGLTGEERSFLEKTRGEMLRESIAEHQPEAAEGCREKNSVACQRNGSAECLADCRTEDFAERLAETHAKAQKKGTAFPEISVILPVYNVQDYIDQCMESLARQTWTDFEMLLINDGSTDGSLEKCLSWQQKDDRILVFDCRNEGVAAARNFGIAMARGNYLAFVDPDDWVDETYLEKLLRAAKENDADYAECDLWRYDNRSGKKIYRSCYGRMGVPYTLPEHMKYGPTATYKAISKKSLWEEYGVRMPGCSFESPAVYSLLLSLSGKIASVREPLYYYRRFRENSLIETGYAKKDGSANLTLGIEAMDFLVSEFQRTGRYEQYRETLEGVVKYRLSDILATQFHRRSPEDYRVLSDNYRAFLGTRFPEGHNERYFTFGGYNLGKILTHMNWLHDPDTRFGFSSLIAAAEERPMGLCVRHKNRYRQIMLAREMERTFLKAVAERKPSYLFLDLLEERFDVLCFDGQYLTMSDAFREAYFTLENGEELDAGELARRGTVVSRFSAECTELWKARAAELMQKWRQYCTTLHIVIIENYLCEKVGTVTEQRPFSEQAESRRTNALLKEYYAYLREILPEAVVVSPAGDPLYFTDEKYEYGAIPSHLNEIENQAIAEAILKALR